MGILPILFCRATGNPIPLVQWYIDDAPVNHFPSRLQQLVIISTDKPSTTIYTCKAMNYIGNTKCIQSANITVIVNIK